MIKSSVAEWRQNGAWPPFAADDVALDPRSWSPLPALGVSGFTSKKEPSRTTGVRILHPTVEMYQYRNKKEEERGE